MSRLDSWDGDDENAMPEGLWYGALTRALGGRRGQATLRELEAALLAMPERRLIEGDVCDGTGVCAVGALAVARRMAAGESRDAALEWVRNTAGESDIRGTASFGREYLGLAWTLAWEIAQANDEDFGGLTPEARWDAMLAWVRSRIVSETAGADR